MSAEVLIIDDEPSARLLVLRTLDRAGIPAREAASGEEALELLRTEYFEVVIVDLSMPGVDGFEVLRWLAQNQPDAVPIVLSGTTRMEDVVEAMHQGAFDFVAKPIPSTSVFVEQIRRALHHKHLHDSRNVLVDEVREKNKELEERLDQLKLAHSVLQSQACAIRADLNRAQRIQQGLLPRELPFWDKVSMAVVYRPAAKVGGDLYDVFPLGERSLGIYIADAAGHGVTSALLTVFLKHAVHRLKTDGGRSLLAEPGLVLRALNEQVLGESFSHSLFVSMTYLVLDVDSRTMRYANAGHPSLILRRHKGNVKLLRQPAPALGINPKVKYSTASLELAPGELLVMHTDGVTDVQNSAGEFYGTERLSQVVSKGSPMTPDMAKAIERDLESFRGPVPFNDDTTVLVLGMAPQDSARIATVLHGPEEEAPAAPAAPGLKSASEKGCTFVSVSGPGTWSESQRLVELCQETKDGGNHLLLLDFSNCTHLDSTFLGVLHKLCTESEKCPGCQLQLQNLPRGLLREMSELGLTTVLMHFRTKAKPLPEAMAAVVGAPVAEAQLGRLLLQAHEALVKADPKNADRFAAVLEVLRNTAGVLPNGAEDGD